MNLLRKLFCRHRDLTFKRNIYGDEILHSGGMRSLWVCTKCGATVTSRDLYAGCK